MDINLPYQFNLRPYQQPIWDACVVNNVKRAVVIWPRRSGKDLVFVNLLCAKALQRPGLYLYVAPLHTQVRMIIWQGRAGTGKKFLDYIPPGVVETKLNSTMEIRLVNGSIIKLLGSDNVDHIVGTNPLGILYTEFSLQKPDSWSYMRPILAENQGFAYFNGTPRGLNHFYQMHRMAQKNDEWFHQYLTRDNTNVPTLEAIQEDRDAGMPESLIQQEYYCSFSASSEEVFIPLDIVKPASENTIQANDYQHEPRILGVDVAYAARGDQAVIAKRQGRLLYPMEAYQGLDNMAFASKISRVIRDWKPHVVFVDSGRGEGVISRLWQMGHEQIVMPVHFAGKTYDELYANKKAEMWGKCREWFLTKSPAIPDDESLIKDLSTPFFELDEKHKIKIESKKALRTRGEFSTDLADALILTFAEDISPDDHPSERQEQMGITPELFRQLQSDDDSSHDYDVLNYMDTLNS